MSAEDQTSRRFGSERSSKAVKGSSLEEEARKLGERLKQAREQRNMSIEDVSEALKLVERTIESMETGDLQPIGMAPTYIEGYYRSYASLMGVAIKEGSFGSIGPQNEPRKIESTDLQFMKVQSGINVSTLRNSADAIVFGFVVVLIIAIAVVIWTIWPETEITSDGPTAESTLPIEDDGGFTEAEVPFYLRDGKANDESEDSVNSVAAQPNEPVSNLSSTESLDLATNAESLAEQSITPLRGETGSILLKFSGLSWVEVIDADNSVLFRDLGSEDDSVSVQGVLPFTVRVGDVSTLQLYFNGEEVDLSEIAINNVANFTLE